MKTLGVLLGCMGPALLYLTSFGEEVSISKASRMFPNALPGKMVVIEKIYDTETKRISIRSNHESVSNAAGLFALEQAEANLVRSKNGALDPGLEEKMRDSSDETEMQVVLSLRQPEGITYLNKFDHSLEELKEQSLAVAQLKPRYSVETILGR